MVIFVVLCVDIVVFTALKTSFADLHSRRVRATDFSSQHWTHVACALANPECAWMDGLMPGNKEESSTSVTISPSSMRGSLVRCM